MTREEYETKKYMLLDQKNEIEAKISKLSEEFHTEELSDYQEMYNGKFILSFARTRRLYGLEEKVPNHFFIHYVEAVKFIGFGFFRFKGKQWEIDLSSKPGYRRCNLSMEEDDLDVYCSSIDCIISKEDAMKRLSEARTLCCEICDNLKL